MARLRARALTPGPGRRPYWRMAQREPLPARPWRWLTALADALLPARCLACGTIVDAPGRLCAACWAAVDFIAPPYCARCGFPFDVDEGPDALCGACMREEPAFDRARAAVIYRDVGRGLVLGFKYRDRTHSAAAFAGWMARAGGELLDGADAVVPVPLHRLRLFARRYNQAALLAREIARLAGAPFAPYVLARTRRTPSQGGLTRAARIANVRGAFAVRRPVAGGRIVLVDDVMTTGATAAACARTLKRAGARRVDVLALARVVPGRD